MLPYHHLKDIWKINAILFILYGKNDCKNKRLLNFNLNFAIDDQKTLNINFSKSNLIRKNHPILYLKTLCKMTKSI